MTDANWELLIRTIEGYFFAYLTFAARKNQAATEAAQEAASLAATRAYKAAVLGNDNATKLERLHVDVNSRITQLLEAVAAQQHAQGMLAGVEAERTRQVPTAPVSGGDTSVNP